MMSGYLVKLPSQSKSKLPQALWVVWKAVWPGKARASVSQQSPARVLYPGGGVVPQNLAVAALP
jgi:hypothetical protein